MTNTMVRKNATISRRDFLKLGGAAFGALAIGQFIPPLVAQAAREAGYLNASDSGYIPSMCEMCVWRCGSAGQSSRMDAW